MFPFRRIRISIYFYMDTTSGMSKSQKPNIDSLVRCRPTLSVWGIHQGKGNHSCTDVAAASSPPTASRGCLGSCWCSQGLALLEAAGQEQDRDWDGVGEATICAMPVRPPVMAQVSPAATQPSQGRRGWGEEGRLGSPIKFYTSLHCFSGCFQNQKIQEIYSQMFPCLFVDSV